MNGILQDVRYAIRQLQRAPMFATIAVITLALGIGASTTIFTVIESVILRPLPYKDSDRLVVVWATNKTQGNVRMGASGPEFEDYKDQARSFQYIADILPHFTYTWTGHGNPKTLNCTGISQDFFPMLGVEPILGRLYTPAEYQVDDEEVVISSRLWKQELGGDPHIIGQVLHLDGVAQTVIGVMPPLPDWFPETDIWAKVVPSFSWMQTRGNRFLTVIGRLRPGVSRDQADRELTAILHRGRGESQDTSVKVSALKDELIGKAQEQAEIAMAAVVLVLFISWANVAYLLLARSCRRQAEIAMRISLGASRGRVVRQFITENLTLALMGGVLGLAVAEVGVRCFVAFQPGNFPRGQAIHIDPIVLSFALFVTLLAALFLAWAPVIVFSRLELVSTLKTGLAQAGVVGRWRLRTLLLSEVTLSLTLLLGAGLLLRSFQNAQHVDPGFQPKGLLTAYLRSDDYAASRSFFPEALRRIAAIPEVQSSAASDCMPAASSRQATLVFNDRPNDPYNVPSVEACWVSPGYFRAIGTPLFTGREFSAHDNQEGTPVAIVNRAFAQAYWPRQNPIGKQVSANYVGPGRSLLSSPSYRQVVGVVGDVRQQGLDVPVEPAIYLPYLQDSTDHVFAGLNLFIRTRSDPRAFADSLRAEIHALRPNQPVENVRTMNDVLFRTLAPRRLSLLLFGAFAVLALFLSAIGIYSVIAYTVGQRMRELGIRVALGAQRQDILQTILREGLLLITGGIGLGIVVSACLSKVISGLLFGVSPTDPLTLGAASAVLFAVGTAACLKPARRAAKVDPMVALRYE